MITRHQDLADQPIPAVTRRTLRALITGASGFIGGHLAERLIERGDVDVRGLVRNQSSLSRLQTLAVPTRRGDVTDLDSLRQAIASVDVVFHLAGVVKAMDYEGFRRVNEAGVANLLQVCAERETPPTVVIVSSLAAAGPAPFDRPREEHDPAAPVSNYGRSKRGGELIAESYADRVPITIVRPPIVFGEHDSVMLALFRPILRHRFHIVPGFKPHRASLIHAADLATMLILAAERGQRLNVQNDSARERAQGYYFAASSEQPTLADMGRLISQSGGQERVLIVRVPNFVAWGVGLTGELLSRLRKTPTIVNCDKIRESLAGSWTCSSERAQQELGFHIETPLLDRLRQTADFYRLAGWLA